MIDEEEKKGSPEQTTQIDDELFKHLSYLSQLSQDVGKHQ